MIDQVQIQELQVSTPLMGTRFGGHVAKVMHDDIAAHEASAAFLQTRRDLFVNAILPQQPGTFPEQAWLIDYDRTMKYFIRCGPNGHEKSGIVIR